MFPACDLLLRLRDIYKSGADQTSYFFRRSACVPTTEFSCQHIRIRCLSIVAHDLQKCFHCSAFAVSGSGTVKDKHTLLRGISCQSVSQRTLKEVCQIRIPAHDLLDKRVPAWTVCFRVVSALAHELGHALFDRKHASSGQAFQDTYFYSLDNSKAERRANIFAAELLLSDDDVLKPIGYYEFNADRLHLERNLPSHCSTAYRAMKYHELMQEFQYAHSGMSTPAEIAQANTIEKHFVDFKLNILAAKGYRLPVLPELHSDFLKDSMKNCEVTMD